MNIVAPTLIISPQTRRGGVNLRAITRLVVCGMFLISAAQPSIAHTWDLATDWSDSSNPNGVWSYNGAPDTPVRTSYADWDPSGSALFGSEQPAWAAATWPQNDHVPAWFKRVSDTSSIDIPIGSVGMHGNECSDQNVWVGVTWTSPMTGTIDVSGDVWFAHTGEHRNADWRVRLNNAVITTGNVAAGDGSSSSTPTSLVNGSGGTSALASLAVSPGDKVTIEFISLTSCACFVGVNLSIDVLASSSPGTASDLNLSKIEGELSLDWTASCSQTASDYAVYEGLIGDWMSHQPARCSTGGATTATITPGSGDHYYLIVPTGGGREGSYGADSSGGERSPSLVPCMPTQDALQCSAFPPGSPGWNLGTNSAEWAARGGFGSMQFNGNTWLLGGSLGPGNLANDVWHSADMVNWTMATAAAPWVTRYWHMSVAYDGKMWTMGGGFVGTFAAYNDVWNSTDGANWTQATGAAAWSPRQSAGLVVLNGQMWLLGGVASEGGWVYKNDVWSSTNGADWTLVTNAAPWTVRAFSAVFVFAGKIWIVGGWNGSAALSDVWYSADGLNWNEATSSAPWGPRGLMPPAVYDNRMWVLGGFDGSSVWNDVWSSTDGVTWNPSPDPTPWSARYEHGVAISGGKMWIFGGGPGGYTYLNDIWSFFSAH